MTAYETLLCETHPEVIETVKQYDAVAARLAELSPAQIRDAFRAAGYSPEQVEAYASTVEARIAELQQL